MIKSTPFSAITCGIALAGMACVLSVGAAETAHEEHFTQKGSPDQVLEKLKDGNERFSAGKPVEPHRDSARLKQAGEEDQAEHAFATVITCSDSRVSPALLFDAGVMDLFVIQVAGNVCDTDEIGSIEYGLAHVNTPVLVILGHSKCGAVKAVTESVLAQKGVKGYKTPKLELNIPSLVDNIGPAVEQATGQDPTEPVSFDRLLGAGVRANVRQSIRDLLKRSPVTRELVHAKKVAIAGAVYDVGTGKIDWFINFDETRAMEVEAAADPKSETEVFAK